MVGALVRRARRRGSRGPHVVAVLVAAVVAAGVGVAGDLARLLPGVESDTVALRFQIRGAQSPAGFAVVAVDDVTISDLGIRWPFPRRFHARAIDRLRAAGVRTIVYDVQFTEETTIRDDNALFEAVRRAGNVVLATSETDERGRTNVLGGDANVAAARALVGASNLPTGADGVLSRVAPRIGGIDTLALAAAKISGDPGLRPTDFEDDGAWIDFRGPPGTIPTYSFSDLLKGRVDPANLRGRVVVVGASAASLQDVHATPADTSALMSGPEIQANAIWTAQHGLPLRSAPAWFDPFAIVLLALAAAVAGLVAKPIAAALVAPVAAFAWLAGAQLAFDAGRVVGVVWPIIALLLATTAAVAARYLAELRERRRVTVYSELLEERVRERTEELRATQLEVVRRLAQAAESRDGDTGEHIERMSRLCERLALTIGWTPADAELLRHASVLHDVGKIAVPDRVLLKMAALDDEESRVMRTHPELGAAILAGSNSEMVQLAETIARTHHERWDGAGYPAGLRGEEIPLAGRICAVCDVYDALVSSRPYKDAWPIPEALAEIARQSGRQFDPALVEAFLGMWPEQERPAPHAQPAAADPART